MKKIIVLILMTALISNLFIVNTVAASSEFSTAEAHKLLNTAMERFSERRTQAYCVVAHYINTDIYFIKGYPTGIIDEREKCWLVTSSSDGIKYDDTLLYAPFKWGTLPTIDSIYNHFTECMTPTLAKRSMYYSYKMNNSSIDVELYRENPNGELYHYSSFNTSLPKDYAITDLKEVSVNNNFATLELTLIECIDFSEEGLLNNKFYKETAEFTKTADGWRVSGGTAFEVMLGDREPNTNPSTGDTAAVTVPALTVAALVSLALPVTLLRKRRRCA